MAEKEVSIFISYSHLDNKWFKADKPLFELIPYLERSLRGTRFWYDRHRDEGIEAGDDFKKTIEKEILRADIAILMISQEFLNSKFITEKELPMIQKRYEDGTLQVFPILLEPCTWEEIEFISKMQLVPGKPTPLIDSTENERAWTNTKFEILQSLKKKIDKVSPGTQPPVPSPVPPPVPSPVPPPVPKPPANLLLPEAYRCELVMQNGEMISDATISCGPRPGGNYVATIQYTKDLGVLKEAKYSPVSDNFIGFDKIACIDFIEMNDEDLKVVKENASYRNHILKMKVTLRTGEIIDNAYFLDHCNYETHNKKGSLQKIKAKTVKIKLQGEEQYPCAKPILAENMIILRMATDFRIGSIDSDKRTFYYISGSVLSYSEKGVEEGLDWYKINGVGDQGVFLKSYLKDQALTSDKRSFFKIAENGQAGYLANIWEGRPHLSSLYEDIDLVDDLAGGVKVKSDQITSLSSKRNEITIQTYHSGTFHGTLRDVANYRNESMTMGPCIVTSDAIIPLVRTAREHFITLIRIPEDQKPPLKPVAVLHDRSQVKFILTSRGVNGFFDERIKDSYIQFTEKFLGGMRISIPRIRRLSVDTESKESPITIETFEGNTYSGKCNEQFNLSGTYISLDNVKSNFVLEALESVK